MSARRGILTFCFLIAAVPAPAQMIEELQFVNQPITDILLSLAQLSRRSIVPDDTVSGTATYYFARAEFDGALAAFLEANHLYAVKRDDAYFISRIRAERDPVSGLVRLDAEEVEVQAVLRALSRAIDRTILVDGSPRTSITVHMDGLAEEDALGVLVRNLGEYELDVQPTHYYVKRRPQAPPAAAVPQAEKQPLITREGDLYSIHSDKVRALEAITELFRLGDREYSILARADRVLENIYFSGKSFDEILKLILEQANMGSSVVGGITYLFEIQQRDVLKRVKTTVVLPLQYITATDLPTLLPQDLASSSLYRLDKGANQIILTGSTEEIGPIEAFIRALDRPLEGRAYCRFDLKYSSAKEVIASLPPRLASTSPIALANASSFVVLASPEMRDDIQAYLDMADVHHEGYPVQLRHLKAADLLKALPPSVSKEDVVDSGQESLVFFVGPEDRRKSFLRELDVLDRPRPQITYQLLVIQYERSDSLAWEKSLSVTKSDAAQAFSVIGSLLELVQLNFDIVAAFGYQFAASLSLKLGASRAKVVADTTLNGLSGQQVRFQNTSTFRYREPEVDDEGKTTYTGVTREITSGLFVDVTGWVSGDEMITMSVSATVSKQGTDTTTSSTDLPPTSEKEVSTTVRTPSGQPLVIGGLVHDETTVEENKVPLLGDIPILGLLFRNIKRSTTQTEFVIYILPRVEQEARSTPETARRLEELYDAVIGQGAP